MNPYSIPPLLTLICFLALAFIATFHGQRTKVNTLFTIICVLGSLLHIDILIVFNIDSPEIALKVSRLDHFFVVYLFPVYIHFFHEYLNIKGRKWLIYSAYLYAVFLMGISQTPLYITHMQAHYFGFFARGGPLFALFGLSGLLVTLYVLGILYYAIQKEINARQKNKLKYVFIGFGIMGLMNGLSTLSVYGYSIYPPGNLSFIPLIIFGVGLFRHNILDMDMLIRKGLIYSTLTTLLTGLYALIILVASRALKSTAFEESIYFPLAFFLIIIMVLGPLRNRIQHLVNGMFSKGKYDYQKTLKQVSQTIAGVLDINDIAKYLMDTIVNAMRVNTCALFFFRPKEKDYTPFAIRGKDFRVIELLTFYKDSSLVQLMKKSGKTVIRTNLLRQKSHADVKEVLSEMDQSVAEIVLPLFFENKLNGFILLGEKRSGDFFTTEDLNLLETLSNQTALAIENARSYNEIENLNKNLEVKIQERTRELKAALEEKEKTQDQLIRSESLAAIGQLVAGTAHELNNPLTSVTSLLQSAIEELTRGDQTERSIESLLDDLRFADQELKRAKTIVSSLLGLSRQTQLYVEAVNLNTVLKDALRVLYNQYKHQNLYIIEDYSKNLPDIQGNYANLGQVAINIIKNAIQAVTDRSGTILLKTAYHPNDNQVEFECADTGPGIPLSVRNDIFKPFFTTKKVGEGTGLGLYICHEIIQRHGGSITLKDQIQNGTCFIVRLPISQKS